MEPELTLYGIVGEDSYGDGSRIDARAVSKFVAANRGKPFTLRINSPGGSAWHAFAIYETLKTAGSKITAHIDGLAASAASIIAMAADKVVMNSAGLFMIHKSSVAALGTADDLRQTAEIGDKIDANMIEVYAARTGLPKSEISAMLAAETWMTAAEAKAKRFIDAISPAKTVAAHFGDEFLSRAPAHIQPMLAALRSTQTVVTPANWMASSLNASGDDNLFFEDERTRFDRQFNDQLMMQN